MPTDRGDGSLEEQFDVACERKAGFARLANKAVVKWNAGAHDNTTGAPQGPPEFAERQDLDLGVTVAHSVGERWRRPRIQGEYAFPGVSTTAQVLDARESTCAQAKDDGAVAVHRSFSVDRPTRTSTSVTIHRRTMTRGSGHPMSSKW